MKLCHLIKIGLHTIEVEIFKLNIDEYVGLPLSVDGEPASFEQALDLPIRSDPESAAMDSASIAARTWFSRRPIGFVQAAAH